MTHSTETLMAINFVLCAGIFWACICRLNSTVSKVYLRVRTRYTLLLAGALMSAFQPALFGEWPTKAGTALAFVILAGLVLNVRRWTEFSGLERREEDQ